MYVHLKNLFYEGFILVYVVTLLYKYEWTYGLEITLEVRITFN